MVDQRGGIFRKRERSIGLFRGDVTADGHSLPQQPTESHMRVGLLHAWHEVSPPPEYDHPHEVHIHPGNLHGASSGRTCHQGSGNDESERKHSRLPSGPLHPSAAQVASLLQAQSTDQKLDLQADLYFGDSTAPGSAGLD